jgi:hypothetical protein
MSHGDDALARLLVAFPNADLPDATLRLYRDRLDRLSAALALAVAEELIATCVFWPTVAELDQAAGRLAEAAAERADKARRALAAPVDPNGRARVHVMLERFRGRDGRIITARELDAAGVPAWRDRLARARLAGPPYDAFEREWQTVRAEWAAAPPPDPPKPKPQPRPRPNVAGGLADDLEALTETR